MLTETENVNDTNFSPRDRIEELFDHTNSINAPSTVIVNSNQIQDYIISFATTKPKVIDSIQSKQPDITDVEPADISHILESPITQNDGSSLHNEEASYIAEDSISNKIDIEDDFGDFETSIQDVANLNQAATSSLEECITNNDKDGLNINETEADVGILFGSTEEHEICGVDQGHDVIDKYGEEFDQFQSIVQPDMGEADSGEPATVEAGGEFYDLQGTVETDIEDADFGVFGIATESVPIDSIAIDDVEINAKADIGDNDFDVLGVVEDTPTTENDQAENANSVIDDHVQESVFSHFDPNTEISQATINAANSNDFNDFREACTDNEVQAEIKTYGLKEEGDDDDDDFGDFHESSHEIYENNDTSFTVDLPILSNYPNETNESSSYNIMNTAQATTTSFNVPSDTQLDNQGPLSTASSNAQYSMGIPFQESTSISGNVTEYNDHSKLSNMLISSQSETMPVSQVTTLQPKDSENEFGDFSSSALEDIQANNWDPMSSDTQKDGRNGDSGDFHDLPDINDTNEVSNKNHMMGNGTEKNAITDAFSIFD